MAVNFNAFRQWAESRFSDVIVKGKEIRINSIFEEDTGHHLWCNTEGGKKKRKNGVFHCFKTDRKGSLVTLVMEVDKCDYDEAITALKGQTSVRALEKRLEEFFAKQDLNDVDTTPQVPKLLLILPPACELISALPYSNWWRRKAVEYLSNRKIPYDGLYICTDGEYKARIIIPYYDQDGKLIYWNGRHIGKSKLRYRGPPKTTGTGKEDVVFMENWPEPGATVYVCEGEFNAKSLTLAGLNGVACGGKNMSEKQAAILKQYKVVVCLDRDKPGWKGSATISEKLNAFIERKMDILLVRPPQGYKDWNEMLVKLGPAILFAYIERSAKPIVSDAPFGTADLFYIIKDL